MRAKNFRNTAIAISCSDRASRVESLAMSIDGLQRSVVNQDHCSVSSVHGCVGLDVTSAFTDGPLARKPKRQGDGALSPPNSTSVQSDLEKGRIAVSLPLAAANGFVWSWPRLIMIPCTHMSQASERHLDWFNHIYCIAHTHTHRPRYMRQLLWHSNFLKFNIGLNLWTL